MMPGINGLDLARRLRFRCPGLRVVLTSAYHLSERQLARADVGAVGFVPKPYQLEDLVVFLREKLADGNPEGAPSAGRDGAARPGRAPRSPLYAPLPESGTIRAWRNARASAISSSQPVSST